MDIVRATPRRTVALRYALYAAASVALVAVAFFAAPSLFSRAERVPVVERATLLVDVARRGPLVRAVRAAGTLVPDHVQVVATAADGVVDELPIRPGARVAAGDTIAVLSNPDLEAAAIDASAQLDAAREELRSAREEASAAQLDEDAAYRTALAESKRADEEARSYTALHASGLVGDLSYRETLIKADENRSLAGIAERKIGVSAADASAKVAAAAARVAQLQAELDARRAQVATLVVRAGSAGVVQSVAVERGQRVQSGTEIARVAAARDLKAVLQVAESDVRGIAPGMPATIDANGSGILTGRVARIAPAAQSGVVPVDVTLTAVRPSVRPDQSVDGTIELARVRDALSIARPANAADDTTIALYRLTADGAHAARTTVRLAGGSLDRVQVLAGLAAGDTVIVSDTSAYDAPLLRIQ